MGCRPLAEGEIAPLPVMGHRDFDEQSTAIGGSSSMDESMSTFSEEWGSGYSCSVETVNANLSWPTLRGYLEQTLAIAVLAQEHGLRYGDWRGLAVGQLARLDEPIQPCGYWHWWRQLCGGGDLRKAGVLRPAGAW